ncbi:hypothetical protein Gasu2_33520 [Galdieria sulphuraria]|nr:hypothetical protein Gasu2_33520 [Galdieria sulphuraria]
MSNFATSMKAPSSSSSSSSRPSSSSFSKRTPMASAASFSKSGSDSSGSQRTKVVFQRLNQFITVNPSYENMSWTQFLDKLYSFVEEHYDEEIAQGVKDAFENVSSESDIAELAGTVGLMFDPSKLSNNGTEVVDYLKQLFEYMDLPVPKMYPNSVTKTASSIGKSLYEENSRNWTILHLSLKLTRASDWKQLTYLAISAMFAAYALETDKSSANEA